MVALGLQDTEQGVGDRITIKAGDDTTLSIPLVITVGLDRQRLG